MTIPEAAQLVLQSDGMSSGGEVFLLEMGEPVNIYDLARRLIRLSGHNLKNENSSEGIEVVFTGLRPGEKLYEELLVDSSAMNTDHPRIFKASEQMLSNDDLNDLIDKCLKLLRSDNLNEFKKLLSNSIVKYNEKSHKLESQKFSNEYHQRTKCTASVTAKIESSKNNSHFFFSSKILTKFLHLYFRMKRGLTLGARCIIVDSSSRILLVKHSYTDGWYIPGGGVELNEACDDALRREISEECGIFINSFEILETKFNTKVSPRDHVVVYFSDDWYWDNDSSEGEIINSRFFAYDTIPKDIEPLSNECIVNWYLNTSNSSNSLKK